MNIQSHYQELELLKREIFDKTIYIGKLNQQINELNQELQLITKATGFCEKHKPTGGVVGGCLKCGIEKLIHSLNKISYICGEPNEYKVSHYSTYYDEDSVIEQVQALKKQLEEEKQKREEAEKACVEMIYWIKRFENELQGVGLKAVEDKLISLTKLTKISPDYMHKSEVKELVMPLVNILNKLSKIPCQKDTNGDGDCGKISCAFCGKIGLLSYAIEYAKEKGWA